MRQMNEVYERNLLAGRSEMCYSNLNELMVWYCAMHNLFRYGAKVAGGSFYARREIKASIVNVVDGCNNVVFYGPWRYGKSSLVANIIEELSNKGAVVQSPWKSLAVGVLISAVAFFLFGVIDLVAEARRFCAPPKPMPLVQGIVSALSAVSIVKFCAVNEQGADVR